MELIERVNLREIQYLDSLTYKEFKNFCSAKEEECKNLFKLLKDFCKTNIKTRCETKRIYSYSLQTLMEMGGRLYSGGSIQGLKAVFRGFLMKHTTDLDMKNAHPVILSFICHLHHIQCPNLDYYIKNRDQILSEFSNRDKGKTAFLMAVNDDKHNQRISNPFFKKFDKEMKEIQEKVVNLECYKDIKSSVPSDKKINWNGSAINRILCMYENKILQSAISQVNSMGIEIAVLMFDGLMVYGDYYQDVSLLQAITDRVNADFDGLDMEWAYKPHNNQIVIPDDWEPASEALVGVKNDMEATERLFQLYPHWVYCLDVLYVFNKESGMWETGKTAYYTIIRKFEKELTILIPTPDGWKATQKSYGNTLSYMEKIPPLIKTLCCNDNWLKQSQYTSLGKILFNNGYFDLKTEKFENFDPNVVFFGKIHQSFTEFDDDDMEYMNDLERRLFFNVLGDEVGLYFLVMLARGLGGDMMKNMMLCLGNTNCGKSTLTTAITLSCGDYVGSFNAENLAYRNTSNDEAQIMRWAMLLRYKRFIFSNEMKSTSELNGNMIKKIASGGDCLIGRSHCKSEEEFITHFLPVCFANDLPKIKPYDDAVDERVRIISYTKKFVDEPSNENELAKDYNLANEMKTEKFQRTFVGMLIRRYIWARQQEYNILPIEVVNAKKDWIESDNNYIQTFMDSFEITNSEDDFVKSKVIEEWIADNKLGITTTKFSLELKKYALEKGLTNVVNKRKKIDSKLFMCWFGIRG